MNFLITSFLFTKESLVIQAGKWGQYATIGNLPSVSLVSLSSAPSATSNWYKSFDREVYCACSSIDQFRSDEAGLAAQGLLRGYIQDANLNHASNFSCTVLDKELGSMWLSGDSIGAIPLWYAFNEGEYIVTTDLLALYHLGMNEPNSVPPGYTMGIDLSTLEITHIMAHEATNAAAEQPQNPTQIPALYARQVFIAALESLPLTILESIVMVEMDPLHPTSLLLDCALDALRVNRTVWDAKPMVGGETFADDSTFREIIDNISPDFTKTIPSASAYEPSFQSMAVERLRICQAAAALPSHTLLSFDAGLDPRPVKVSLQNFFCGLLNVTVLFPFRSHAMQRALYNTNHPTSYLIEALGYLHSPQPHNGLYPTPNMSFQPVCRAPASSMREWNLHTQTEDCSGVGCADRIVLYAHTNATAEYGSDIDRILSANRELESKIEINIPAPATAPTVNTYSNTGASSPTRSLSDPLLSIWRAVHPYATQDGIIVLLLVTRGYADMLTNFLCAARALQQRHFLILTHDEEIITIAKTFNVGHYSPPSTSAYSAHINGSANHDHSFDTSNSTQPTSPADADFGTIRYQELIYSRTELTLQLLLCGYHSIIADVDAVWLSDPLLHLPWRHTYTQTTGDQKNAPPTVAYDIAITDDNGEVCGCFVALRATAATIHFWSQVTTEHRDLIRYTLDNVRAFDESEQKILTRLLYQKRYQRALLVFQLPAEYFPSGYEYFNLQTHRVRVRSPAVVHNNFIIGKALKRARFQRYGMWSVLNSTAVTVMRLNISNSQTNTHLANTNGNICIADATLQTYATLFTHASRNTTIPSLNLYLPVHNSVIYSETVMAHASAEGPIRITYKQDAASFDFVSSKLHINNHPPSYLDASPAVFGVLNVSEVSKQTILPYTLVTSSDAVSVSVDVGYHRNVFSMDRGRQFVTEANEYVLRTMREGNFAAHEVVVDAINEDNTSMYEIPVTYSIRIITYNRPRSLQRLLASLLAADYADRTDITLHIVVDAAKTPEAVASVAEVTRIVEAFEWPFGPKSIKLHSSNVGLVGQWLNIWTPTSNDEAAFILEDDMEVSPYFFMWAVRAAELYYAGDIAQQDLHAQLVNAVEKNFGAAAHNNYTRTPLQEFARATAGRPLLYGICLQKQHLDPNHHPKKLQIRNGHRPFLYSLVGSWAPLMLPQPWRAFLAWQAERKDSHCNDTNDINVAETIEGVPLTERLVTNHFLDQNPRIWTPWHIRFAFESGAKCLYPNLPGEYALVVNHREAGENYAAHGGPDGDLVTRQILEEIGLHSSNHSTDPSLLVSKGNHYWLPTHPSEQEVLKWSLIHLPDMATLTQYQYDFNLRRAGALGSERTYNQGIIEQITHTTGADEKEEASGTCSVCGDFLSSSGVERDAKHNHTAENSREINHLTQAPELLLAWSEVHRAMQLQSALLSTKLSELSAEHWVSVVDMIESSILPGAAILHTSYTPMAILLSHQQNIYQSTLLIRSSSVDFEDMLPQYGVRLVRELTELLEAKHTLLVIDAVHMLSTCDIGHTFLDVCQFLQPVEYILVIGACSSAPTDLAIQYKNSNDSTTTGDTHGALSVDFRDYMMVEDVCSIANEDIGAVLYRDVTRSKFPKDRRFSVSRRLSEVLQTRRTVDAQGLT